MSDRVIALKHELREARAWMTDPQLAEVVTRCASYGEIHPFDLHAVLQEYRPEVKAWKANEPRVLISLADAQERERRAERIVELWAQGLTLDGIAPLVNMSRSGVCTEVRRLREKGYDLPARPHAARFHPQRKAAA